MKLELLIDHYSREAVIAALIHHALSGVIEVSCDHQSIFLKEDRYDFFERTRHAVGVLVTPSYNVRTTPHLLARAYRQSAVLVVQHSEQLYPPIFLEEKLNTSSSERFKKDVFAHIVWGIEYARVLRDAGGVPKENIYICGNPKLDLAKRYSRLRAYGPYEGRTDETPSAKRTVLFISNFPFGDYDDARAKRHYRMLRMDSNMQMHRDIASYRERCLAWIANAARRFPRVEFVVRPHPGESDDLYRELCRIENISVSARGELGEDLASADLVLMHTSSSVFEVLAIGKNALSLDVGRLPTELTQPPLDIFAWITEEQCMEIVRGLDEHGQAPSADKERLRLLDQCMHDPGGNSVAKHAIALAHICSRLENDGGAHWSLPQRWHGVFNQVVPLAKHCAVRMAAIVEAVSGRTNRLTEYSRQHWKSRIEENNHLSKEMWEAALDAANELLVEGDYLEESKWRDRIELTDSGWLVH